MVALLVAPEEVRGAFVVLTPVCDLAGFVDGMTCFQRGLYGNERYCVCSDTLT